MARQEVAPVCLTRMDVDVKSGIDMGFKLQVGPSGYLPNFFPFDASLTTCGVAIGMDYWCPRQHSRILYSKTFLGDACPAGLSVRLLPHTFFGRDSALQVIWVGKLRS
jgi:hypothetical protein